MKRLLHILNPFTGYETFRWWLAYTVGLTAFCWYAISEGVENTSGSVWNGEPSGWFVLGFVVLIPGGLGWLWWTGAALLPGGVWLDDFRIKRKLYDDYQRDLKNERRRDELKAERDLRERAAAYGLPLPEVEPMEQIVERVRKEWEAAADPYILDAEWDDTKGRPSYTDRYLDLPNRYTS